MPPQGRITSVRVGVVGREGLLLTDHSAKYRFHEDSQVIFTDYLIRSRFEKDRQIYMLPVTRQRVSPGTRRRLGGSAAFVQLAEPTLLWIVDWTASRTKEPPPIPDPRPSSANDRWILLDEVYEPASLTLGPDGVTPLYRISGTYVYGHPSPDDLTINNIGFPRPPWMANDFGRTLTPDDLEQNLL